MLVGKQSILVTAALLVGIVCYVAGPSTFVSVPRWAWSVMAILAAAAAIVIPRRLAPDSLDRLRHPAPRRRRGVALVIALLSSLYLAFTAYHQDRDFFPKTQDDQAYI